MSKDREIAHLHPQMQGYFHRLQAELTARDLGVFRLWETARGHVRQERGVEKGTSRAHYGESRHNYGLATDWVAYAKIGGRWRWSWDVRAYPYSKYGAAARAVGLEWGGDWPSFAEGAHVQAPGWTRARLQLAHHLVAESADVGSARWHTWARFWLDQVDDAWDLVVRGVRIGERMQVAALQQLLHLTGTADPGRVDGELGPVTRAAAAKLHAGDFGSAPYRAQLRDLLLGFV